MEEVEIDTHHPNTESNVYCYAEPDFNGIASGGGGQFHAL